ncbi:hypothetical protein ACI2VK_15025 [Ralstonia nicotianae]|nr:hypothetical protein [Ralstonia solanacearum]
MVKEGRPLPRAAQEVIDHINTHLSTLGSEGAADTRVAGNRLRVVGAQRGRPSDVGPCCFRFLP